MKILFSTTAGTGHFRPLLPFAAACAEAGHDVAVAAPLSFARQATAAGYRVLPFGDIAPAEIEALMRAVEKGPGDRVGVELFARLGVGAGLPGVRAAIERYRPSLIVRDVAEMASLVAAEEYDIPQIPMFSSVHRYVRGVLEQAVPFLEQWGLRSSPVDTPALSFFPASFDPAVAHRFRNGTGPDPATPRRPLVYLSYGTVTPNDAEGVAVLRTSAEALSELPVDLIVSIGPSDRENWRDLKSNVYARPWVDEDHVLARASAVVCHGGGGTTLAALRAGVPLLVVPQFGDQPAVGDAVVAGGAGLRLGDGGRPDPGELRAAAGRILGDPSFRARAAELAREIDTLPPVEAAVKLFKELGS